MADKFYKQEFDSFVVGVDYSNVLALTEETLSLSESSITAYNSSGEEVSDILVQASMAIQTSTILRIRVEGGTAELSPYKITFKAITNADNQWEKDVKMHIEEI
jgi:hypothetical protein